jgi:hypothetical protein
MAQVSILARYYKHLVKLVCCLLSCTNCQTGSQLYVCACIPDALLEPDDVTFAVLVRGYGETEPPQWLAISGLLSKMQSKFNLKPNTGDCQSSEAQKLFICLYNNVWFLPAPHHGSNENKTLHAV